MYSVEEAATHLGVSERFVRFLLAKGQVEGKKLGHDWVVLSLDYKRIKNKEDSRATKQKLLR